VWHRCSLRSGPDTGVTAKVGSSATLHSVVAGSVALPSAAPPQGSAVHHRKCLSCRGAPRLSQQHAGVLEYVADIR